jgi:two-component system response regulator FixJ
MLREPYVHVIDDDPDVLRSLSFLLTAHGMPVRTYGSAAAFLDVRAEELAGCILSDVRMPEMDGIELLRTLSARGSILPFIVMTGHADVPMAIEAMKEGATDFIEKPYAEAALTAMVGRALARWRQTAARDAQASAARGRLALLSQRERQVLEAIAAGRASKAIAHDLGLSVRTVEVHRANILMKLAADNTFAAVAMLVEARASAPDKPS